MNNPNAPQMNGGGWTDDITASVQGMMPGSATPAPAPAADEKTEGGILDKLNPFASPAAAPAPAAAGGKGKRKSATKRRKSHKKKGKSSKKRAHKRR
jgi:hypothetical protein